MEKRSDYIRIYPSYFDRSISKKEGRKVPKKLSIDKCNLDTLILSLKILHIDYTVEQGLAYPRRWWMKEGRIRIKKEGTKHVLLKKIGKSLVEAVPKHD
ncbi:MAG: signal recognition particle subunit SRP19/SEC65 family protein [Candidatus Thermoplasmatota archaeon]|jgi:signal recognition particle subunit SRP19|nr:signal recognition particle subunit SRP19/SEC65 family protein [Candidatus Thermoplasmatota archaeon]MCL5963548.1 signal recognition particle subunit SRP19/SEC65 family protein [Candidatus Thermoplasmatota archaeon]